MTDDLRLRGKTKGFHNNNKVLGSKETKEGPVIHNYSLMYEQAT